MEQDMVLTQAMLLLRETGVRITGGNLDALSLTLPDRRTWEVKIHVSHAPPTPSKLEALTRRGFRTLIVVSRPNAAVKDAAVKNRIDLISVAPASVMLDGVERLEPRETLVSVPEATHGRTPWGRWAMLRALALVDSPLTQQELADVAGISQPAVNKNLKSLAPLVDRAAAGWRARNVGDILSEWVSHYPGPRGVSTYWYSLKSPAQQAEAAADFALQMGAEPLVSGDAAADIYAPWRLPDTVHLYLREAVDFTDAGFSSATPKEATLITTIPEDPTLWLTALLVGHRGNLRLADPLIILRDVLAGNAADSPDAAEHLRNAIIAGAGQ